MIGIKVPGQFVSGTVNGFVTEARWVKGTYIVVNTVEEANQVPLTVRVDGTPVYVVETKTEYRWLNGDWEVKPQPLQDAPVDGKMYARLNGAWAEVTFDTHHLQEQIDDLYSKLDGGGSIGPATEDTLGGILATNLDAQEGTSAYVGVEEDGKAFVKIPNVSPIIDVEELPTENINENVLYRKAEQQKYLIQGGQKVADGETVDGVTGRIIDVEVLPDVGIPLFDESTNTMNFYIQTSTMTAHIYRGAEEGWADPSSLWGESWSGVITSEDQVTNSELIYILYSVGLVDIVYSICNGKKNDMNGKPVTCIVVDTLPETGEACTDASSSFIKLYYQKQDGIAYGYLTAELSGSAAMWKTINELSVDFLGADLFGGYIADDTEATDSTKLYIVHKVTYPTYKLYHYKYEWHEVGSGGKEPLIISTSDTPTASQIIEAVNAYREGRNVVASIYLEGATLYTSVLSAALFNGTYLLLAETRIANGSDTLFVTDGTDVMTESVSGGGNYSLRSDSSNIYLYSGEDIVSTVTIPTPSIDVDSSMSTTSTNPVQNKVIKTYIDGKIPIITQTLTSGTEIGLVTVGATTTKLYAPEEDSVLTNEMVNALF